MLVEFLELHFVIINMNMKTIKILLLFSILPSISIFAQNNITEIQHIEQQSILGYLNSVAFTNIPDSSAVFTFAFKINVKKNSDGKYQVTSIIANDNVGKVIYPTYDDFFRNVKYWAFMKGKKEAIFIVPVTLIVRNSKGEKIAESSFYNQTKRAFFDNGKDIHNNIYFRPIELILDKQVYN